MPLAIAALVDAMFVLVHVVVSGLRFFSGVPRSRWLSAAGGVSVAYVFLQILPELASAQERVRATGWLSGLESHVYIVALLGLATFYGVERWTMRDRAEHGGRDHDDREPDHRKGDQSSTGPLGFAVSIGSFAAYNVLIGYLLLRDPSRTPRELATYGVAMALHFLVTDWGLREHHKDRYDRIGRWVLALAVTIGVGLGAVIELPDAAVIVVVAFLAGGVVLNVLKEELPEQRRSRFSAFLLGAAAYSALLLAT